ncbi:protein D2-like [Episyrphus balteatus]|uniref:protein D2-like n=1 Tax=Episyrphus balteatus TaxID=286459 RepID=UPI0024862EE5|nr:protein D2-like [Episyrphus balteatus]
MDSNGIIPDVVDFVPEKIATVTYPSGVIVEPGKELTPTQVKDIPNITWDAESDGIYAVLMVDPDGPSRENPIYREFLHWSICNIPGNDLSKGQTLFEYIGAGPSNGTGLHRYIFWVFKQPAAYPTDQFVSKTTIEGRANIKTRDYVTKFNLGNPVAGNYFLAQYDEYVDTLQASLKTTEIK